MRKPILVLQYPDIREARTVALASTRNKEALLSFKRAAIEEAQFRVVDRMADDILQTQELLELERLKKVLNILIPDMES